MRDSRHWLRAERAFESLLRRCPAERTQNEAEFVNLVLSLEDLRSAERAFEHLNGENIQRVGKWMTAWHAQRASAPTVSSAELRAVRSARSRGVGAALELAETMLTQFSARGELLAEIATLRLLAEGEQAAKPYFDRARVALQVDVGGMPPRAVMLQDTLSTFDDAQFTPDGRELWLWGTGGLDGFGPQRDESPQQSPAVVFDTQTWEPIWRARGESRACGRTLVAAGAGFASCDGLFVRDGRGLKALPEPDRATQSPFAALTGDMRLLSLRKEGERTSRIGLLHAQSGDFEPLKLPLVERAVALDASPGHDWFVVESVDALEVFAYPTLTRLLRAKGTDARVLDANRLAFITPMGDLEVWQLKPPKRLARHYLPQICIPHGSCLGSSYFRSGAPEKLWIQHLASDVSWDFVQKPEVRPANGEPDMQDQIAGQSLHAVSVAAEVGLEAQLRRDDRLEFDELRVSSPAGNVLTARALPVIKGFAVSPNGKRIALDLAGKNLSLFDFDSSASVNTLEFVAMRRLAFYDDEHLVVELPRETWLVDARTGSHSALALRTGEHFFARGSSGVTVTKGYGSEANAYDAQGTLQKSFSLEPLALSPSGTWLLLQGADRLVLANTREGTRAALFTQQTELEQAHFSSGERRLATLGASGLTVWDTATGTTSKPIARAELGRVTALGFAEHDDVIVVGEWTGTASAFHYTTGERLKQGTFAKARETTIRWASTSRFLRAFRRSDGKWLGGLAATAQGAGGFALSAAGELELLGAAPVPEPRCAFSDVLVAWGVCRDELQVSGLLKRFQREAAE